MSAIAKVMHNALLERLISQNSNGSSHRYRDLEECLTCRRVQYIAGSHKQFRARSSYLPAYRYRSSCKTTVRFWPREKGAFFAFHPEHPNKTCNSAKTSCGPISSDMTPLHLYGAGATIQKGLLRVELGVLMLTSIHHVMRKADARPYTTSRVSRVLAHEKDFVSNDTD